MRALVKSLLVGCLFFQTNFCFAKDKEADYVVVGLGAAGFGVVKYLAEDCHTSIIALEAGANHDEDEAIQNSTFAPMLEEEYFAQYFYQLQEIPQEFVGEGMFNYTTGRLFGGGSSINGLQYVRGSEALYEEWEELLGSPWTTEKIFHTFEKLEKYNGITPEPSERGFHGPIDIRQAPALATAMAQKFVDAVVDATGFDEIVDYNLPETALGPFTRWQLFEKPDGSRVSSSTAYLHNLGSNVEILEKTTALRIIFDEDKAIGVEFLKNGKSGKVFAKKRVIICAGIFSPQLLMLSGIGPKADLQAAGVDVVYNNPHVGQNLSNHFISFAMFSANPNDIAVPANDQNAIYTGGAFLPDPTPGSDQTRRGVQLIGISFEPGTFMLAVNTIQPKSKGFVQIQSSDPLQIPLVSDEVFSDPADLETFKNVFKVYVRDIAESLNAIDPAYELLVPSPEILDDDALLGEFIKSNLDHAHHWVSSCRMAPLDQGGVVDRYGQVYGVKHLMVIDDSILPFVQDGNTTAPAMMVARLLAKEIVK